MSTSLIARQALALDCPETFPGMIRNAVCENDFWFCVLFISARN